MFKNLSLLIGDMIDIMNAKNVAPAPVPEFKMSQLYIEIIEDGNYIRLECRICNRIILHCTKDILKLFNCDLDTVLIRTMKEHKHGR